MTKPIGIYTGNNFDIVSTKYKYIIDIDNVKFLKTGLYIEDLKGLKVLDIVIEGVSMAITYRQEYATIISQQGGMPGLISALESRARELAKEVG